MNKVLEKIVICGILAVGAFGYGVYGMQSDEQDSVTDASLCPCLPVEHERNCVSLEFKDGVLYEISPEVFAAYPSLTQLALDITPEHYEFMQPILLTALQVPERRSQKRIFVAHLVELTVQVLIDEASAIELAAARHSFIAHKKELATTILMALYQLNMPVLKTIFKKLVKRLERVDRAFLPPPIPVVHLEDPALGAVGEFEISQFPASIAYRKLVQEKRRKKKRQLLVQAARERKGSMRMVHDGTE